MGRGIALWRAFSDDYGPCDAGEFFMRVTTSSFHCPSYCFCKPPPHPPLSPPPVRLPSQCQAHTLETEDPNHTSCSSLSGSPLTEEKRLYDEKAEKHENGVDGGRKDILLKSSLKKTASSASKEIVKECVKWTDDLGKELVEIREFEPIESGELDDELYEYPTCACVIL